MTKRALTTIFVSATAISFTVFSISASASSSSNLELNIIPKQCWLEIIEAGTGQSLYITPDQCVKERVIKEFERYLGANWLMEPYTQYAYSSEFAYNNSLVVEKPGSEKPRQVTEETPSEQGNKPERVFPFPAWLLWLAVMLLAFTAYILIKKRYVNRPRNRHI